MTYNEHNNLVTCYSRESRERGCHHQRDAICEQSACNSIEDKYHPLKANVNLPSSKSTDIWLLTKKPSPWNLFAAVANTMMIIVAMMTEHMVSNIRWPNHKPTGFPRPFDICIAWTDERRSRET